MTAAIVLAAGLSRRMGCPKLTLPWGDTTVIGRVVDVLLQAGAAPVLVVSGAAHDLIEAALGNTLGDVVGEPPVRLVFNPRYLEDQMAFSLQAGLEGLSEEVQAVLVALGDQPQIDAAVVRAVLSAGRSSGADLVVPSYQMHRGHPWLVSRILFPALMAIQPPATLRDFLVEHASEIHYLAVDSPTVLQDLDTPEDYQRQAPQ